MNFTDIKRLSKDIKIPVTQGQNNVRKIIFPENFMTVILLLEAGQIIKNQLNHQYPLSLGIKI